MKVNGLVIQVESWAREELAAQKAMATLLERQEQAVSSNDTDGVLETTEAVRVHMEGGPSRDRRRRELIGRLASAFGVAHATLTLGSIAQRAEALGVPVTGLLAVRAELRDETARVLRLGRRISSVARYHQGFLNEVLSILAPEKDEADRPVLLDARG